MHMRMIRCQSMLQVSMHGYNVMYPQLPTVVYAHIAHCSRNELVNLSSQIKAFATILYDHLLLPRALTNCISQLQLVRCLLMEVETPVSDPQ